MLATRSHSKSVRIAGFEVPGVAGMVVGLLVGLFQALTQIQEQTVSFVPKIVAMVLALSFALPWLVVQMVQYANDLILSIPTRL